LSSFGKSLLEKKIKRQKIKKKTNLREASPKSSDKGKDQGQGRYFFEIYGYLFKLRFLSGN
jgi:hypothetical protein